MKIEILGVNDVGQEVGNPSITDGRDIPWLQDRDDDGDDLSDIRYNLWGADYRDVIILDNENIEVGRFNLTDNDLANQDNYNTLRSMLVYAATVSPDSIGRLDTSLVLEPTATETNGEIAAVPADAEYLLEWQSFSYEVWVSTPESVNFGVTSASATVSYNTDYFTASPSIEFGPAFAADHSSSVDDGAGQVLLAATTSQTDVGDDRFVLLARVSFEATGADSGAPLDPSEPTPVSPMEEGWIALVDDSSATVELADIGPVDVEIGSPTSTALYPVMYDLDNDNKIGFGDLSFFSAVFLDQVDSVPQATKCDFDLSGSVNFGDLAFLSANFLKSRAGGEPIVSPLNFPDDFASQPAASSSSSAYAAALCACVSEGLLDRPTSGLGAVGGEPLDGLGDSPGDQTPEALVATASGGPQEASMSRSDELQRLVWPRAAESDTSTREHATGVLESSELDDNSFDIRLLDDFFASLGG